MVNSFADRLKSLIDEKGINQSALAKHTKLGTSTISQWVNGQRQPSVEYIIILANYFDVSADYLLGRTKDYEK